MRRIYGIETEYGLRATSDGRRVPADEAALRLFAPIAAEFRSTNAFLPSGGRLYLDIGSHPEYATPECTSAADAVIAQRAGDALLLDLAEQARVTEAAEGRDTTFTLSRNNRDSFGNTWGSHENSLVARDTDPDVLAAWLVPFLIARQLIGGAGHWKAGRFTLSQRGDVLGDVISNQTTRSRPLINTRDEPHSDPERFRRLHVISGDTNTLEHPMWLVLVSTELVLRLAESGRTPPPGLADPMAALRAWNSNPDARVATTDERFVTCWDVHNRYLEFAAELARDDDETGPGWQAWRTAIDDLAAGRPSLVEWDAKRRLITAWRDRHGLADDAPQLDALDLRWHELGTDEHGRPRGLALLAEAHGRGSRLTTDADVEAATQVAPSASRARVRGRLIAVASEHGRDYTTDWSSFTVHDLGAGGRRSEVRLQLDDPFAAIHGDADALAARMAGEPRLRALGGFVPPSGD